MTKYLKDPNFNKKDAIFSSTVTKLMNKVQPTHL